MWDTSGEIIKPRLKVDNLIALAFSFNSSQIKQSHFGMFLGTLYFQKKQKKKKKKHLIQQIQLSVLTNQTLS